MIKISEAWLREWCDSSLDIAALVQTLTMAGLEIEGTEAVAPDFSGVVVGHVHQVSAHPNADRLQVCQVQLRAQSNPAQSNLVECVTIVCGAPNVAAGQRVAVALPGALLPNNFAIAERSVRKITSYGMLCSQVELGLAESSDGIWVLPSDAPIGVDLRVYLQYDDQVLLGDFTPNRGDCLSVKGLAREISALTSMPLIQPPLLAAVVASSPASTSQLVPVTSARQVRVQILAPKVAWHYLGRVIENVNPQAQTPLWMLEKLRRAGLRAVNPAVDVTNYVMLELGQPLHAFDLDQLQGDMQVRMAIADEKLLLLDGREVLLKPSSLVIADDAGAVALAGVMGGLSTRVTESTTQLFLECASFAPSAIAGQARLYGLQSDAAHRFERGVDIDGQLTALEYASTLLIQIMGGQAGPITQVHSAELADLDGAQRPCILLTAERLHRLLGFVFPLEQVEPILTRLGFSVSGQASGWQVTPPSFRFDVQYDVDLIEELVRVLGYDQVPSYLPKLVLQPPSGAQWLAAQGLSQAHRLLVDLGYSEVMTYSFVDPQLQSALSIPENSVINVLNPISADLAQMRGNLWVGLLKTVERNQKRQIESLKLFESGLIFVRSATDVSIPIQVPKLSGVWAGNTTPLSWHNKSQEVDFFAIKGDVERLLSMFALDVSWQKAEHSALHPGQSAQLIVGNQPLGWLGQVHPAVLKAFDLQGKVYVFELDLNYLVVDKCLVKSKHFVEVSRFPEIRRDLAICVASTLSVADVMLAIGEVQVQQLRDVQLFDVYQGPGIADGHKSLALALSFQHQERTLTESEVEVAMMAIKQHLLTKLQATLRE
jgi:phenylalanyl-tRNA synthetase beta chain